VARLAQLDDDNAAFDRAVEKAEAALTPGDWLQRRELASVLLSNTIDAGAVSSRNSEENDRDLKRAFKCFGEAIAHNNEDVESSLGFRHGPRRASTRTGSRRAGAAGCYQRAPAAPR